jgi:hypothetical protein
MAAPCIQEAPITYRNFNFCPHCAHLGQQSFLDRLREGMPMISRSDGRSYHLYLADRPLPYPLERSAGRVRRISACFWYSHTSRPELAGSTIVILPDSRTNHPNAFRMIEAAADLLAEELFHGGCLATLYEFFDESLASTAA